MDKTYKLHEVVSPTVPPPQVLLIVFRDPELQINNKHEALLILLDLLVQEEGFVPCIPRVQWKKKHYYSMVYTHPAIGDLACQLKYLPHEKGAFVFATIRSRPVAQMWINPQIYVNDHQLKDVTKLYKSIPTLNVEFKNKIVLTMIASLKEWLNIYPPCSFLSLANELKMEIIYKMDAKSLVAFSAVNHELRELVQVPSTWQHILYRDFPEHRDKTDENWREIYKTEYVLAAKRKKALREKQEEERQKEERRLREQRSRRTLNHPFALMNDLLFPGRLHQETSQFSRTRRADMARPNFSMF